jgi:hypothetical protein
MQFRLLAPHNLQRLINGRVESLLVEKGTVVSAAEYVNFAPTPAMEPLDAEAYTALYNVCEKARANLNYGQYSSGAEVPGYGNEHLMPGGDLYGPAPTPIDQ